ncbi:hypothetical protein [Guptibacillus sedimenti]|uniref:hypothetical protein n=1 Tax=Guptibacillus sedimenti TaxID=3025680 RepID=UPI002360B433|nr:hypothetical protein [Pseudalkalibacillus sedimenti]
MINENPFVRLHSILSKSSTKVHPNKSLRNLWADTFDVNSDDINLILIKHVELFRLYDEAKDILDSHEKLDTERNQNYLRKVLTLLKVANFEAKSELFQRHITQDTLTALYYLAENVSFIYSVENRAINVENIQDLLSDINTLQDNLMNSSLPEDITKIIYRNLSTIKYSLDEYELTGFRGVREALERSIGSIVINKDSLLEVKDSEEFTDFFKIITRLNTLYTGVDNVKKLGSPLLKLLGMGD